MELKKTDKQNIGNAGEYFIAAILSAKNYVVTITLGRNMNYDILGESPKGKLFKLSVKTRNSDKNKHFLLNVKYETIISDDLYYCFIRTNYFNKLPDYWIIPSKIVAERITESHKKWLMDEKHKDNPMRNFHIADHSTYPENWEKTVSKYEKNLEILDYE